MLTFYLSFCDLCGLTISDLAREKQFKEDTTITYRSLHFFQEKYFASLHFSFAPFKENCQCLHCHQANRIQTCFIIHAVDLIYFWQSYHRSDSYSFYFSSKISKRYIWMLLGERQEQSWHFSNMIAEGRHTNHEMVLPVFVSESVL